jgi:hypothetical protein
VVTLSPPWRPQQTKNGHTKNSKKLGIGAIGKAKGGGEGGIVKRCGGAAGGRANGGSGVSKGVGAKGGGGATEGNTKGKQREWCKEISCFNS